MYETWVTDGHYIQAKKVGKSSPLGRAYQKAVTALTKAGYGKSFRQVKDNKEVWIEDSSGRPFGILVPVQ